jgi:hypothetical protein
MAASVVQGIDTLTAAMTSNIVPDQEYLLQGRYSKIFQF